MADITTYVHGGLAITTRRLRGLGSEPRWLAWGVGSGDTAVTDTQLFAESDEGRVEALTEIGGTEVPEDTYVAVGTLTTNAAKSITNCGLFDARNGGQLFVKSSFTPIPLNAGDAIQFTIKCQYRF